ncbi:MAG: hypothetical protein OEL57_00895 [Trichlorobacter sp.]|uniref:hypothetical protein n=1 Tax=Trichlorobacter sp. TaxID=2911007 RepID=UPI0025635AB0|nr:hypothetical protein [Trichlorobacter sp.]MDK9716447.1 hypothetical protein [Trichlorobacter sp.]
MTKPVDESIDDKKQPRPEMLLGLSLPAVVELFGVPLKYLSVVGLEIVLFGCRGVCLVCTFSHEVCVQARYTDILDFGNRIRQGDW